MAETALSQNARSATVDPDHPWLGLHPFAEDNQHYFFGRTVEIRDIFLRVRENPLTLLYANSGLGKTSLLRAGLIPKLRVERFRPVHLLLDFSSASPSLTDQVREALAKVCIDPDADVATLLARWAPLGNLWEIYAHETLRPAGIAARPPVLIFDQFEEVFTLGGEEPGAANTRKAEVAELFTQIADLVENRAPAAVQALFQDDPQRALAYDFGATVARVVLALREDFLAQFEQWKSAMPSLMRNRMPLRLLTGPQALEAVVRPGRMDGLSLVSDQVGEQIVRFVAQRTDDTPLEEIEAVPPLVSLVCERLNAARLEAKPRQEGISEELVKSQGADILQRFYDESFAAFLDAEREAVRAYIEERMVTVGGHRNPVAREDAVTELARRGVSAPDSVLNALIARRLLTAEQRGGIQRLEITHDVLAPLVVRGRKEREEHCLTRAAERRTDEAKRKQAKSNSGWQLDLEVSYSRAGDVLVDQGKLQDALEAYQQSRAIIKRLAEQDKSNSRWQRGYAVSFIEIGDVLVKQGKLPEALEADQQALAILKGLAEQDKSNSARQRDLEVISTRVGNVLMAQGKLQEALDLYQQGLAIAQHLAEQDKSNLDWQRDLSVGYGKVGDVLVAQGKLQDALEVYQRSVAIAQHVAEQDKSNLVSQADLSDYYESVGDVLVAQGKLQDALDLYHQSLNIRQTLAGQDNSNSVRRRELISTLYKVGTTTAKIGGNDNVTRAQEFLQTGLNMAELYHGPDRQTLLDELTLALRNLVHSD